MYEMEIRNTSGADFANIFSRQNKKKNSIIWIHKKIRHLKNQEEYRKEKWSCRK